MNTLIESTATFDSSESKILTTSTDFSDLKGEMKGIALNIHRREPARMQYETDIRDTFIQRTNAEDGQSTFRDNFMSLTYNVLAPGEPTGSVPLKCLERDGGDAVIYRERFAKHLSYQLKIDS